MHLEFPLLGLAAIAQAVSAASSSRTTVLPAMIVQLDAAGDNGVTTAPIIQNKNSHFSIEVAFDLTSVPSTSTCSLNFVATDELSDWAGPAGTALVNVYALTSPIASSDTFAAHAKVGDLVSVMNVTTIRVAGVEGIAVSFSPETVPCTTTSAQFLFDPGTQTASNTIIMGWEQTSTSQTGVQLLA